MKLSGLAVSALLAVAASTSSVSQHMLQGDLLKNLASRRAGIHADMDLSSTRNGTETGDNRATENVMEKWVTYINEDANKRRDLLTDDVHLVTVTMESNEPVEYNGKQDVISFFMKHGHASKRRTFLSTDLDAFAVQITKNKKMGVFIMQVNEDGLIFKIRGFMGSFKDHEAELQDSEMDSANTALLADNLHNVKVCASESFLTTEEKKKFDDVSAKVHEIDFSVVLARLVKKEEYDPAEAEVAVDEYRKYLVLVGLGANPVPSEKVDDAWHAHIVYTRKYEEDCKNVFGQTVHHEPANLLLDDAGMAEQKSNMRDMYGATISNLCKYYGQVNEYIWDQKQMGYCACACGCACR